MLTDKTNRTLNYTALSKSGTKIKIERKKNKKKKKKRKEKKQEKVKRRVVNVKDMAIVPVQDKPSSRAHGCIFHHPLKRVQTNKLSRLWIYIYAHSRRLESKLLIAADCLCV